MANNNLYEFKYKSWRDVPISEYYRIVDVIYDEEYSENEKIMALIGICLGISQLEAYNIEISEINSICNKIQWIFSFDFNKRFRKNKISLNGNIYIINPDLTKFTVSQYIDFELYWKTNNLRKYYGNILACFMIPEGKKYGEGYNTQELANEIYNSLDIVTANEICFFFLNFSRTLIKASQISLEWMTKKATKGDRKMRKELMEAVNKMNSQLKNIMNGFL